MVFGGEHYARVRGFPQRIWPRRVNKTVSIPIVLLPALKAAEARYRENGGSPEHPPAAVAQTLSKVWACSRFVADACARNPAFLDDLNSSGLLASADSPAARAKAELKEVPDEKLLMTRLRRLRRREMVRIAWRDLAGLASLDETLRDLTAAQPAQARHEQLLVRD